MMELLEHLRRQFAYDECAPATTARRIEGECSCGHAAVAASGAHSFRRAVVAGAHPEQPQSLPVWPDFTLDQCEAQIADLALLWREFFGQLSPAGLSENVVYKNSKGEPWTSTVGDVLTHVVLHSAYH